MIKSLLTSLLFKLSHVQAQLFVNHSNPPTNHSDLCHNIWSQSARRTKTLNETFQSQALANHVRRSHLLNWQKRHENMKMLWFSVNLKSAFPVKPASFTPRMPLDGTSMARRSWATRAKQRQKRPHSNCAAPSTEALNWIYIIRLTVSWATCTNRTHLRSTIPIPIPVPQHSVHIFDSQSFVCVYFGSVFFCCHLPALREKSTHSQNHSKHTNTSVEWRALLHVVTNVSMMMLMMRVQWGDLLLSRHAAPCSSDTKH